MHHEHRLLNSINWLYWVVESQRCVGIASLQRSGDDGHGVSGYIQARSVGSGFVLRFGSPDCGARVIRVVLHTGVRGSELVRGGFSCGEEASIGRDKTISEHGYKKGGGGEEKGARNSYEDTGPFFAADDPSCRYPTQNPSASAKGDFASHRSLPNRRRKAVVPTGHGTPSQEDPCDVPEGVYYERDKAWKGRGLLAGMFNCLCKSQDHATMGYSLEGKPRLDSAAASALLEQGHVRVADGAVGGAQQRGARSHREEELRLRPPRLPLRPRPQQQRPPKLLVQPAGRAVQIRQHPPRPRLPVLPRIPPSVSASAPASPGHRCGLCDPPPLRVHPPTLPNGDQCVLQGLHAANGALRLHPRQDPHGDGALHCVSFL